MIVSNNFLEKYFTLSDWDIEISLEMVINPLTAEVFNLNFYPLEVVSRWRDPQLQVSEKTIQIWQNGGQLSSNIADWCHIWSLTCLKGGTWCDKKNENPNICGTGG